MCDFVPLPIICFQCGTYVYLIHNTKISAHIIQRSESVSLQSRGPYLGLCRHGWNGGKLSPTLNFTDRWTYIAARLFAGPPLSFAAAVQAMPERSEWAALIPQSYTDDDQGTRSTG